MKQRRARCLSMNTCLLCHSSFSFSNNNDDDPVSCDGCNGRIHAGGGCIETLKIAHYNALLSGGLKCPSCAAPMGDPEWGLKTDAALDTLLRCRRECQMAISCIEEAAESGESAEALVALGQEYYWGYTLDQDFQLALTHSRDGLRKHAEDGLPLSTGAKMLALKLVAGCCAEGFGTNVDYTKALEFWTLAANLGDNESMVNLSRMYREGIGTDADSAQADTWLERSCRNSTSSLH